MPAMRYATRAALLCCLLCLSAIASAQQLPLHHYVQTDGLGNLAVNVLAQDPDGYLWVGTENGLYRYDGAEFRRFGPDLGLRDPDITALHIDPAGRVWVGTQRGLYLLRDRLVPVLRQHRPLSIWPGSMLASTRDGRLLVVSNDRLVEVSTQDGGASWEATDFFSAGQLRAHPQLTRLASIHAAPGGELWMGCDRSLCRYERGRIAVLGASNGVPENTWDILAQDAEGTLWARSDERVIALPAEDAVAPQPRFLERTPRSGSGGLALHLRPLAFDAEGRALAGMGNGIARWNGNAWESFDAGNGLQVGGGVNAILVDREGELWLGTLGYGLIRWIGYPIWENWTVRDGLPGTGVWSFHRDRQGVLHVGTKSGMAEWRQDLHRFSTASARHEGAAHQRSSIAEDAQGNLWSGTFTGFLIRQDASSGRRTVAARLPSISQMLVDRAGRLWIATIEGLYLIEHPGRDSVPVRVEAPATAAGGDALDVRSICEGRPGTLWLATNAGLLRRDRTGWHRLALASAPAPFSFHAIACSKSDDTVWLGDSNGIWRVHTDAATPNAVDATPEVLRQRLIFALQQDSRGWLWAATDYGVAVWNGAQWRIFDQQSGLVWNDCNAALYEDRDGSMWIGTSNGASHVRVPERLFAGMRMDLAIERIARDEKTLPARTRLDLPWQRSSLRVEVAAPSYRNREALVFRYRMAGLETSWTTSRSPVLHYPPLPPGRYRLQIVAENPLLQTASGMVGIDLEIRPLWWQSQLFYCACALALLLAVLGAHRYRLRRVVARQQALERLILERTRELEQSREALRVLASRDGLTGALNRRTLMEALEKGLAQSRREHLPLTLMLVDLDHFKQINDSHGHPAGDAVLKELVRRFARMVRAYDSIGRYGGEEFALVLPGFDGRSGRDRVAQLQRAIGAEPVVAGPERKLHVTCSAGVAVAESDCAISADELIAQADAALYRAKALGRNRVEYAGEAPDAASSEAEQSPDLLPDAPAST